jgi:hypothetical protein
MNSGTGVSDSPLIIFPINLINEKTWAPIRVWCTTCNVGCETGHSRPSDKGTSLLQEVSSPNRGEWSQQHEYISGVDGTALVTANMTSNWQVMCYIHSFSEFWIQFLNTSDMTLGSNPWPGLGANFSVHRTNSSPLLKVTLWKYSYVFYLLMATLCNTELMGKRWMIDGKGFGKMKLWPNQDII